jgi:hypothetical protein
MPGNPEHELQPVPIPLPEAFAEQVGYRFGRRLVAFYFTSGHAGVTDGEYTIEGGSVDPYLLSAFLTQPQMSGWLAAHQFDLGSSLGSPKHWLLVDRQTDAGYLCPARAARDKVRAQRLEE